MRSSSDAASRKYGASRRRLPAVTAAVAAAASMSLIGVAAPAAPAADSCVNAAIRAQQHSDFLKGCRAYEMVSPVDKGGTNVNVQATVQVDPAGNNALFSAPVGFPGAPTSTSNNYYRASRADDRWGIDPIEPAQHNPANYLVYTSLATSADLTATLQVSRVAAAPGAVEGGGNIYLRDNRTGQRKLIAVEPESYLYWDFVSPGADPFDAGTPDFSHVVFEATAKLTDDAIADVNNVYDYSDSGGLRLVSVLPDGSADPAGGRARAVGPSKSHRAISDDGKRIVFEARSSNALYLREGGTTIPISVSQRAGDPDTPQPAEFSSMTGDGSQIFFTSSKPLTDDTTNDYVRGDIYRYDVASGELTDITVATDPADVENGGAGVKRISSVGDAGDYVYFAAIAKLAPGGTSGMPNVYRWSPSGTTFVATLNPNAEYNEYNGPESFATSPSGRFFAFTSRTPLGGYDTHDPACGDSGGQCMELYVYDAETQHISCPSCDSVSGGQSAIGGQFATISKHYGRAMTDTGRVFFETSARLVAGDTNGKIDVYEGSGDAASLISTGKSSGNSFFTDASADGSSVFIGTAEPLVRQDVDGNVDLYVARVDGGLAAQNTAPDPPVPCVEDGCQDTPSAPPGRAIAGSVTFLGSDAPVPGVRAGTSAAPKVTTAKTVTGISALLRVKVSGKGRIGVSGSGLVTSSRTAAKAGTYTVGVRLSQRAQQTLKRKHRLTVRVAVRFVPSAGKARSVGVSVTFKAGAASKKRGRS